MIGLDLLVRSVFKEDHHLIANLIHFEQYTHRHLDWRGPLEWVGSPYFWMVERNGRPVAALACPPDPETIHWIRLFASASSVSLPDSWHMLWDVVHQELASQGGGRVAVIALHDWMIPLLEASDFQYNDDIVMMEWTLLSSEVRKLSNHVHLRPMEVRDLIDVADTDAAAFDPLWRNSLPSLRLAYPQSGMSVVAEVDSKILGYQITTFGPFGAHLARLAVHPSAQRQGIGSALVANIIEKSLQRGMNRITVNTQAKNYYSQKLYSKSGFVRTGESYPVYIYDVASN